jgi:two-component system chemotaxis sensor kinase CheA
MILDPNGMSSLVGSTASELATSDEATLQTTADTERTSLLLFEAGGSDPKAVPLGLVSRLEEIDMANVETSGDRPVIQYRGELMPLVIVDGAAELNGDGKRAVLVFADGSRKMGVVVDQILDIVEERLNIELASTQPGYIGGAVLNGRSTDVIDIGYYATQAYSDWFRVEGDTPYGNGEAKTSVLIVDDSAFFRNLLVPMLSVGGYAVTTAESPPEALAMRDDGRMFDLIISDIDMPGMSGFDFATECRADPRWQKVPMVALSSHTATEDFERGRAVGFNDYVAKSDRETLMSSLQNVLATVGENA